jgi:hypothetical protein
MKITIKCARFNFLVVSRLQVIFTMPKNSCFELVSQNLRIPNLKCGKEGPSGARKILKKFALLEEDISTLILFNT